VTEEPLLVHRVIARLNVGGPAMHVVNLTRALDEDGWRTRLVAGSVLESEGDMEYYAREREVEVTTLPEMARSLHPLADLRSLWALWRLFRRERPDVVHTHTAKAGTLGRIAAALAGVPVRIHTFHGHVLGGDYFPPAATRFFLWVEQVLARVTHRLVVLTETQAREMADDLGVAPRERFAVVPLGLELETFRQVDRRTMGPDVRTELGLADGEVAVGIVGRLVPIKNHELFLEGLAAARDAGADHLRGVVIGAGEREAELQAYARSLGLTSAAVLWLGWRRDLPRLSAALDLVALTSHDEGTPVALLEALAAGTPVLARAVGGVAEVLEGAGAGTTLPVEAGPEAWGEAMVREANGEALDAEVRDHVTRRYSVARLAADLAVLYRAELSREDPERRRPEPRDGTPTADPGEPLHP